MWSGAIYLDRNIKINIDLVYAKYCFADSGGLLYIFDPSDHVKITRTKLEYVKAKSFGGAIYFLSYTYHENPLKLEINDFNISYASGDIASAIFV